MGGLLTRILVTVVVLVGARGAGAEPLWAGTVAKRTLLGTSAATKPPMVFIYELDANANVISSAARTPFRDEPASVAVAPLPDATKARFVASRVEGGRTITKKDQASMLRHLRALCMDTWCEGDYSYQFTNITCNETAVACTVTMKRSHYETKKVAELRCTLFAETPAHEARAPILTDLVGEGDTTLQLHDHLSYCLFALERLDKK